MTQFAVVSEHKRKGLETSRSLESTYDFVAHFELNDSRRRIQRYIADRFKAVHDADIKHFLPILLSISRESETGAALGLQFGAESAMFLEQYLSNPIEQEIAALKEMPVARSSIVEVGNLVISHRPSGLLLFILMTGVLERLSCKWMVFTATRNVENMLKKLGYSPFYLADAPPEVLGDEAASWGQYYQNSPRVLTGSVDSACQEIGRSSFLKGLYRVCEPEIERLSGLISTSLGSSKGGR